jgi:SAM-dependent methyltransferase
MEHVGACLLVSQPVLHCDAIDERRGGMRMDEAPNAISGAYLLGDSPAELDHLVAQAEVYATEAEELLDRIGIAKGTSAIDIGCGVLGILHVLSTRVGTNGRVVGLDREPRMIQMARTLTADRGLTLELVEGDATDTGLASASFDLVHARTVLLNVSNPGEIVSEMVRLARPGGVVAVQEPDSAGWVCDPPHPAWELLRSSIVDAYRRNGKDFNIGRRSGRLLRDAGLTDVQVRPTARATKPGDYYQTFLLTIATLVRDQILAAGSLTADEFVSYTSQLREHLSSAGTLTSQPMIWQTWGTKPS